MPTMTHFHNESCRLTAAVKDYQPSRRIHNEIQLSRKDSPQGYYAEIGKGHQYDRNAVHEMAADKAYEKISHGINADH